MGYDVVGDIAIVAIGDELIAKEQDIAEAILARNRRIRVVAKRAGFYERRIQNRAASDTGRRKPQRNRGEGVRCPAAGQC